MSNIFIAFLVVEGLVLVPLGIWLVSYLLRNALRDRIRTFATFMCLPRAAVMELAQRPIRAGYSEEDEEEDEDDDASETGVGERQLGGRPLCMDKSLLCSVGVVRKSAITERSSLLFSLPQTSSDARSSSRRRSRTRSTPTQRTRS